ncbi:Nn.00g096050.m01.CDS01 [Neocucurbitaria sp. VM-36]
MLQSSLSSWLNKPSAPKQTAQTTKPPPVAPTAPNRPPPPPKSASAPTRVPSATTAVPSAMDNWNDIPDGFLQAPSRPRPKKSPRSSRNVTPAATPRVPSPATLPIPKPSLVQLFALRPLPANVQLAPLTEELMPAFKRLNALTLPIPYPESFYKETMTEPHHSITLVALWHASPTSDDSANSSSEKPHLVGAVRCRLLPSQLYISTLGILAPYRSHGIAMHLLQAVVKKAVEMHSVRCVTAHVWEANEEGLEWYKKRNFEILGKEDGYYRKLRPQGAFLVRKWIGVGDLLGNGAVDETAENGHAI